MTYFAEPSDDVGGWSVLHRGHTVSTISSRCTKEEAETMAAALNARFYPADEDLDTPELSPIIERRLQEAQDGRVELVDAKIATAHAREAIADHDNDKPEPGYDGDAVCAERGGLAWTEALLRHVGDLVEKFNAGKLSALAVAGEAPVLITEIERLIKNEAQMMAAALAQKKHVETVLTNLRTIVTMIDALVPMIDALVIGGGCRDVPQLQTRGPVRRRRDVPAVWQAAPPRRTGDLPGQQEPRPRGLPRPMCGRLPRGTCSVQASRTPQGHAWWPSFQPGSLHELRRSGSQEEVMSSRVAKRARREQTTERAAERIFNALEKRWRALDQARRAFDRARHAAPFSRGSHE